MSSPFIGSEAVARGLLTRGQLRWNYTAIHPDVYVPNGSERTLDVHGASWVAAETPVELIGCARRRQPGVIVREERIAADEVVSMCDLLVTTPERTALDLARHLPRSEALARLDALAAATGIEPDASLGLADRYRGARGVRRARAIAPLTDAGAQSPRESWLRLLLIDAGFPRPVTQIPVSDSYRRAFIDLGWDEPKIGLEYEGGHHQSDRAQFVWDIGRQDLLEELGWLIIRVVKEHSRAYILQRVNDAFNRRRFPLARSA